MGTASYTPAPMSTGPYHRLAARSILAVALLALPWAAQAQDHDEQVWLQINTNVALADDLQLTLEQIGRFGDAPDGLYQTEFGGLLALRASRTVEVGVGYRKVGFHNGNTAANENRLRQQVVARFGPVTTRFRVDERFHPDGDEIGFRIRPLVRYTHRLGTRGFSLFASHESFFLPNSTRWGQRSGYERMRNMVGVGLPIARGVAGDLGYLNQYRFARAGRPAQMDHALNFQLTFSLDDLAPRQTDD